MRTVIEHGLDGHPRITTDDGTVFDLPQPVLEGVSEFLEAAAAGDRAPGAPLTGGPHDRAKPQPPSACRGPTVVRLVEAGKLPRTARGHSPAPHPR